MLTWPLRFLILAVTSAFFGFGGIAGSFGWLLRILFVAFLLLLIASTIARGLRGNTRTNYSRNPNPP